MKKIYITEEERKLITSTPPKECWICDLFSNNIFKDNKGLYILEKVFDDEGIVEHFNQIIKRDSILNR